MQLLKSRWIEKLNYHPKVCQLNFLFAHTNKHKLSKIATISHTIQFQLACTIKAIAQRIQTQNKIYTCMLIVYENIQIIKLLCYTFRNELFIAQMYVFGWLSKRGLFNKQIRNQTNVCIWSLDIREFKLSGYKSIVKLFGNTNNNRKFWWFWVFKLFSQCRFIEY